MKSNALLLTCAYLFGILAMAVSLENETTLSSSRTTSSLRGRQGLRGRKWQRDDRTPLSQQWNLKLSAATQVAVQQALQEGSEAAQNIVSEMPEEELSPLSSNVSEQPQQDGPEACTGEEEGFDYKTDSPAQCETIRFFCDSGEVYFANDCGCGCKPGEEV
jgi:hypothetical protein